MFKSMNERLECERRILSSLLLEGKEAYAKLPALFDIDCFEDRDHQSIFQAIKTVVKEGGELDIVRVAERCPKSTMLIVNITTDGVMLKDAVATEAERLFNHELPPQVDTVFDSSHDLLFVDGRQLVELSKTLPPIKDLLKNILRQKSLNFLAGESGCGKSIFAMNLALSVAVGAKTFLAWEIEHQGKVLYLNHELYLEDFAGRFHTMSRRLPVPGDISNLFSPKHIGYLSDYWKPLNEFIAREKPCLVIVDCLYFAHGQDESNNSEMKDLIKMLISLRDDHDTCVLVVHHTKKGTQGTLLHNDQMRGAGVFAAASDTILMLRRSQAVEGVRIVKATKLRHAADEELRTRALRLDDFLWFRDIGVTTEEEHLIPLIDAGQTVRRSPSSTEAQVLNTILGLRSRVQNGLLTNSAITTMFNSTRSITERLSAKKMNGIVKELGFEPTTGQGGGNAFFWNESHLEKQCLAFRISYSSTTSESRESRESSESSEYSTINLSISQQSWDRETQERMKKNLPILSRSDEKRDSEVSEGSDASEVQEKKAAASPFNFGRPIPNPDIEDNKSLRTTSDPDPNKQINQ